jgi:hypothetical protein
MTKPFNIEIVDDLMVVLDEDGNGQDCHELRNLQAAKRQLKAWQKQYTFDYAEAEKALSEFFSDYEPARPAVRKLKAIDAKLAEIAKNVLKVPTLAYRNRDCLDFHELSVGQIKLALRAAYEAGRASVK